MIADCYFNTSITNGKEVKTGSCESSCLRAPPCWHSEQVRRRIL
jgi:hypothetical protein